MWLGLHLHTYGPSTHSFYFCLHIWVNEGIVFLKFGGGQLVLNIHLQTPYKSMHKNSLRNQKEHSSIPFAWKVSNTHKDQKRPRYPLYTSVWEEWWKNCTIEWMCEFCEKRHAHKRMKKPCALSYPNAMMIPSYLRKI